MRTKITLGTSGTIELLEDIPLPLNYAVADIKKPDTRQGSYSKTLTIPGSKANNLLFAHIFEIDIDCRFNPNIKTPCVISVDDIVQLSGFLRLMKVSRTDDNLIQYECTVIGNVSNIFTTMGDADLSELSMAEYNHTYNKTNQKASWTTTPGSGYVYPFIDYGFTDGTTMDVTNFYPAIYVKTYIDKIFEYCGFSYSSTFFDSSLFKRLIIPLNSNLLKLSDSQIAPRLFESTINPSGTITLPTTLGLSTNPYYHTGVGNPGIVPINQNVSDVSNQFNTSTYRYVNGTVGSYNFSANFNYQLNSAGSASGYLLLVKYSAGYFTVLASDNFSSFGGISDTLRTATISASNIDLLPGDEVWVGVQVYPGSTTPQHLNVTGGSFKNTVNNIGIFDGDTVNMTLAIPQKVKMKEFFMSIVKMFNLYIETDKENSNKLYIEPRNDFYSLGKSIDWTDKWDISQPLDIIPMGELDGRKYVFTYTEDKDYYNELYKKSWNETYGTKTLDINNEFITGNKENKVIFSPTPLVNNGASDRTIPEIFSTDSAGNITPKQSNIRILYYGGVKSTLYPWTYTGAISGTTTESTYPYAGHLDDVANPTIDLSFGVPNEVYYTATSYTNNNLYNAYYKQFIEEITDKDSKIVTGHFYLTPKDILTLDFRNQFYVDGHYLRLNKVIDYNPINQGITKCEFIKIKSANAFVSQTGILQGGVGSTFDNGDPKPSGSGGRGKPGVFSSATYKAFGNFVNENTRNVLVTGSRNHVGAGSFNVTLFNSSGCTVMPGLHGVTLINSSGVTVIENDVTYINGTKQTGVVGVGGSGTVKYLPVFTLDGTHIGNSLVYQDYNGIAIGTTALGSQERLRLQSKSNGQDIIVLDNDAGTVTRLQIGIDASEDLFFKSTNADFIFYRSNVEKARLTNTYFDTVAYKVGGVAGADGSFTTVDGKTVTVTKGIVTSIA